MLPAMTDPALPDAGAPLPDLRVSVTVQHRPERSQPGRTLFQYVITIENHDSESWQVLEREWQIEDGRGEVTTVQGAGVVGETPVIAPGGVYVYDSFVSLEATPGRMVGRYVVRNAWGARSLALVPAFVLALPGETPPGRVLN